MESQNDGTGVRSGPKEGMGQGISRSTAKMQETVGTESAGTKRIRNAKISTEPCPEHAPRRESRGTSLSLRPLHCLLGSEWRPS